ncbi:MAG: hypothetical protein L0229_27535 [Blastocatellia bacterium]|nr:hypothetical protein [Blastocatellia bacterium]
MSYDEIEKGRKAFALFVLLSGLIAVSCSPGKNPIFNNPAIKNPILGKWKPHQDTLKNCTLCPSDVEFTKDMMIIRDGSDPRDRIPVEYEIKGDRVIVKPQSGMNNPFVCMPTEGDTLTCNMPLMGPAVFVRRE